MNACVEDIYHFGVDRNEYKIYLEGAGVIISHAVVNMCADKMRSTDFLLNSEGLGVHR